MLSYFRPTSEPDRRKISPVRRQRASSTSNFFVHLCLFVLSLLALLPFLLLLSTSFSAEKAIDTYGYSLFPHVFSLAAYQYLLSDLSQVLSAYGVTIIVTLVGTALGLLIMSMLAYTLARKSFGLRKPLSFYVFFTMLFNGGLVPFYLLVTQYLHLKNSMLALILPYLVVPWFVLLLRTYFAALPNELIEAAKMDGAGELRIFFQLVLPLSTPALATIGLFSALMYWNDWWLALLFIDDKHLYPLQYLLYIIQSNVQAVSANPDLLAGGSVPTQSVQMAMAVLAVGPIVFVFLFVQRYFIRGITLGGLKGD